MMQAEKVTGDLRDASESLGGDGSPIPTLSALMRRLERRAIQAPELIEPCLKALDSVLLALDHAQTTVDSALRDADFDPSDLETVEERLFALRGAARKHGVQVDHLPALAEKFAADLAALDAGELQLAALAKAVAAARDAYRAALATGALFAVNVFVPLFPQTTTSASPTEAGLLLLPMMVGITVSTNVVGRVLAATGRYRRIPTVGLALMTAGLLALAVTSGSPSRLFTCLAVAVFGLGFGVVGQVLTVAVQNDVDRRQLGTAMATTAFFRALGGAVGAAVLGAVFAARSAVGSFLLYAVPVAGILVGLPVTQVTSFGGFVDAILAQFDARDRVAPASGGAARPHRRPRAP